MYHWDGIANVKEIVKLASEEGLYVILRPGPYICAEIDNVIRLLRMICIFSNYIIFIKGRFALLVGS